MIKRELTREWLLHYMLQCYLMLCPCTSYVTKVFVLSFGKCCPNHFLTHLSIKLALQNTNPRSGHHAACNLRLFWDLEEIHIDQASGQDTQDILDISSRNRGNARNWVIQNHPGVEVRALLGSWIHNGTQNSIGRNCQLCCHVHYCLIPGKLVTRLRNFCKHICWACLSTAPWEKTTSTSPLPFQYHLGHLTGTAKSYPGSYLQGSLRSVEFSLLALVMLGDERRSFVQIWPQKLEDIK